MNGWKAPCEEYSMHNQGLIEQLKERGERVSELNNRLEELEKQNERLSRVVSIVTSREYDLIQQMERYKKALEDFANHGTRHDLNPIFVQDGNEYTKLLYYVKNMDDYVRVKARHALEGDANANNP